MCQSDIGHPFLSHLDPLKNLDGNPWTNIEKCVKVTQDIIQLTTKIIRPIWKRISLKKHQYTLSYTFLRSTLSTITTNCFFWSENILVRPTCIQYMSLTQEPELLLGDTFNKVGFDPIYNNLRYYFIDQITHVNRSENYQKMMALVS